MSVFYLKLIETKCKVLLLVWKHCKIFNSGPSHWLTSFFAGKSNSCLQGRRNKPDNGLASIFQIHEIQATPYNHLDPTLTRLCHCHEDKKYPCLIGIGLKALLLNKGLALQKSILASMNADSNVYTNYRRTYIQYFGPLASNDDFLLMFGKLSIWNNENHFFKINLYV